MKIYLDLNSDEVFKGKRNLSQLSNNPVPREDYTHQLNAKRPRGKFGGNNWKYVRTETNKAY